MFARLLGLFGLAFLLLAAALLAFMPALTDWTLAHCAASRSMACALSGFLVADWFLLAPPVLLVLTLVLHRSVPGRKAKSTATP